MTKFTYDGDSLPMLEIGKGIFRIQRLVNGRWETFTSEDEYNAFLVEAKPVSEECMP